MPLVGMYSSYHTGVIRQHAIWLIEAGVTCIEIDWSNSLWGHQKWAQRGIGAQDLNNATVLALQVYAEMRKEGHDVPKALFMVGLQNGPPATPSEVGNEAAWIHDNLISTLGPGQFVQLDSKPLLLVLYCGNNAVPNASVTHAVSREATSQLLDATQLRENPDLCAALPVFLDAALNMILRVTVVLGRLSPRCSGLKWLLELDGWRDRAVHARPDGQLCPTVTPLFSRRRLAGSRGQGAGSWCDTDSGDVRQSVSPDYFLVCQWNEWAGSRTVEYVKHCLQEVEMIVLESTGCLRLVLDKDPCILFEQVGGFVDAYNLTFTNDLEPTALAVWRLPAR